VSPVARGYTGGPDDALPATCIKGRARRTWATAAEEHYEVRYSAPGLFAGAALSALSIAVAGLAFVFGGRRR
jgi:hypothetical protein